LHRASDKGRFCHHCGSPLLKDQALDVSGAHCPACTEDVVLQSRRLSHDLAVLECPRCAGLWLEWEPFRLLEKEAQRSAQAAADRRLASATPVETAVSDLKGIETRAYRPCIVCGNLMHRRNYARSSGVIIDTCKDHGVWFDFEELARILTWIRRGGWQRENARQKEELTQLERQARLKRLDDTLPPTGGGGTLLSGDSRSGSWLLDALVDVLLP
jgi:Zn-finger nucleic acid-binding protein